MIEEGSLLPCPFCGGAAEVCYDDTFFGIFKRYMVECTVCWASTHGYADTDLWKSSRQEALDAWNRRPGA